MQLFSLSAGGLGEAEALPEIDGTIEEHAWSPDGSRILVRTAGMHADGAGQTAPAPWSRTGPARVGTCGRLLGGPAGLEAPLGGRRRFRRGSDAVAGRTERLGGGLVR